jgi:hypothetical protein
MGKLFEMNSVTHEIEVTDGISEIPGRLIDFKKQLSGEIPGVPVQWAPTLTEEEMNHWYSTTPFQTQRKCLYPWRGITVDADGKIYPCSKIYLELGNLEHENVFDAWNGTTIETFRKHLKCNLFPACSRCCKL